MEAIWDPTEEGAYKTFKKFFSSKLASYSEGRDFSRSKCPFDVGTVSFIWSNISKANVSLLNK